MIEETIKGINIGLAGILLSANISCNGIMYGIGKHVYNSYTHQTEECLSNVNYPADHPCYGPLQEYKAAQERYNSPEEIAKREAEEEKRRDRQEARWDRQEEARERKLEAEEAKKNRKNCQCPCPKNK